MKQTFEGENNKAGIISFMHNPTAPPASKPKEADWAESNSDIVHLTATNFEPVTKEENSVLIMFYAPWCGHCKRMKPEYEKAAEIMKNKKVNNRKIFIKFEIELIYPIHRFLEFWLPLMQRKNPTLPLNMA